MIDFHAHILPSIDDGPRSIDESAALMECLHSQEIDTVICTPHFYSSKMSLESFIRTRDDRMALCRQTANTIPMRLIAGAEVYCDEFLLVSNRLEPLLIEKTSLLMLELPFSDSWSAQIWQIIEKISSHSYVQILVAHADRYPALYKHSSKPLRRLIDMECLIQVNCDALLDKRKYETVFKWIEKGYIHLLGTDCHNLDRRPPKMLQARQAIVMRYGQEAFDQLQTNARKAISGRQLKDRGLFF